MKGYWVCVYEKIDNSEKLKEYASKAKPAEKFSGKFLSEVKKIERPMGLILLELLLLNFLIITLL